MLNAISLDLSPKFSHSLTQFTKGSKQQVMLKKLLLLEACLLVFGSIIGKQHIMMGMVGLLNPLAN